MNGRLEKTEDRRNLYQKKMKKEEMEKQLRWLRISVIGFLLSIVATLLAL